MNFKFTPFQGFVTIVGCLIALGFGFNIISREIARRECNTATEDCSRFYKDR